MHVQFAIPYSLGIISCGVGVAEVAESKVTIIIWAYMHDKAGHWS